MQKEEFQNQFGELKEIEDQKWGKYFSFYPNKLPPEIDFDKKLILSLTKAEATLSKLSGIGLFLPNPDLLISPYLKKEALSSSRIEGTMISLDEYFLHELEGEETIDSKEVTNYIKATNYALEKIEKEPISKELIKEIHKILMEGVRGGEKSPGEFRDIQNWIGPPGSRPQNANFVPPANEEIETLIDEMIEYMNTYDEMPILVKCALMHYQFETIHPFCDGNGRIGRTLIILYLIKKNKLSKPLLYLSYFFEQYKNDYINLLSTANKRGEFNNWLHFFFNAIKTQSEEALEKAVELKNLKEEFRNRVQNKTQQNTILKVVDSLFINPYISIKKVQKITGSTYPTSKGIVDTLESLDIIKLRSENLKRNKRYYCEQIINILK